MRSPDSDGPRRPKSPSERDSEGPGPAPPGPPPLGPLPSGRHRFSREQVSSHQRERLLAGLVATVAERGYAATTVGEVAAAAQVSRRVFYQHFETKEECFAAAFDVVFEHLRAVMLAAAVPLAGDWPRQVAAALAAALGFFASEPALARLCLVESPSAGPALQRRFAGIAEALGPYLRAGREEPSAPGTLPDSTEPSLIGAVGVRMNREAALRDPERLRELLPELVEFVLTPYVGTERARRYAAEVEP